ncbi:MAG: TetR/AcrR family transcriptional regulator [Tissierellia bacterium]|nr:TetR/AcrR family transcriptional regulator [Tissierellia bacterium]
MRKSKAQRQEEILNAAQKVFLKKGFVNTTMEDVIAETSLSKGGFYHYFKSTNDILYELMAKGIQQRNEKIEEKLDQLDYDHLNDFIAHRITEKILDNNDKSKIYVEFLLAKKEDLKLEELYKRLQKKTKEEILKYFRRIPEYLKDQKKSIFICEYVNSLIIGNRLLEGGFSANYEIIRKNIKNILDDLS